MKISQATLLILANLAKLNQHIVIMPGSKLRTVDSIGARLIEAEVDETFPVEIALHDLPGFLKVINLFEEPEFEFKEKFVLIRDEFGAEQKYFYSDKEELIYNDKEPRELPLDIKFKLQNETLSRVLKSTAVNGVEDLAFVGENGKVFLKAIDKENPTRSFSIEVTDEDHGDFTAYLKHKKDRKLTLFPIDYEVGICKGGAIRFEAEIEDFDIAYTFAIERDSSFE